MRTAGIIVEYNPLHNGHVHHYEQTKLVSGADAVIAVMSGHFLQRGEPALVNKWARAEMALHMGADLVLELPVLFSAQPAEWFAFGAVSALHNTGVVDALCFGSESGSTDWMLPLARSLKQEPEGLRKLLKKHLKSGLNYPSAFSLAVAEFLPSIDPGWLAQPNNTLGLHYLIALERLNSRIEPMTISRIKAGYNQETLNDHHIASATALRKLIGEADSTLPTALNDYVPSYTLELLKQEFMNGRGPITWEHYARPLFHQLLAQSPQELSQYMEVKEGLEYRIRDVMSSFDFQYFPKVDQLLDALKTKR